MTQVPGNIMSIRQAGAPLLLELEELEDDKLLELLDELEELLPEDELELLLLVFPLLKRHLMPFSANSLTT